MYAPEKENQMAEPPSALGQGKHPSITFTLLPRISSTMTERRHFLLREEHATTDKNGIKRGRMVIGGL